VAAVTKRKTAREIFDDLGWPHPSEEQQRSNLAHNLSLSRAPNVTIRGGLVVSSSTREVYALDEAFARIEALERALEELTKLDIETLERVLRELRRRI
jgi:hypothetical protein